MFNISKNKKNRERQNIPLGKKCKYAPLFGSIVCYLRNFKARLIIPNIDRDPAFLLSTLMIQCTLSVIHILKVSLEWEVSLSRTHVNADIARYHLPKLMYEVVAYFVNRCQLPVGEKSVF